MRNETDNLGHGENGEEAMEEKTAARNYTGHGWEGEKFDRSLDIKDIAKLVRKELKGKFPASKFSVRIERYSGGQSIYVSLASGPFDPFTEKASESHVRDDRDVEERVKRLEYDREKGYTQVNQYHWEENFETYHERGGLLSERAYEIMKYVSGYVSSYRRDDSDGMIDYFDTNFYAHYGVGKWDKPFENTTK